MTNTFNRIVIFFIAVALFYSYQHYQDGDLSACYGLLAVVGILLLIIAFGYFHNKHTESVDMMKAQTLADYLRNCDFNDLPSIPAKNVILRKGEISHFSEFGDLLEMRTQGYESVGSGVRVRVAKGVSIGSYKGRGRAIRGLEAVSHGELVITNKRIVFAGDRKSFEIPYSKLTNIQPYKDGINFHSDTKFRMVSMPNGCGLIISVMINRITSNID